MQRCRHYHLEHAVLTVQALLLLRAFVSTRIRLPTAWAVSELHFGSMSVAPEQSPVNLISCHWVKQGLFLNSAGQ